jgi:hypothetical protein
VKKFLAPNLDRKGRLHRALLALALLLVAALCFTTSAWLGLFLAAAGVFVMFEALRGWCIARACGIKTRF